MLLFKKSKKAKRNRPLEKRRKRAVILRKKRALEKKKRTLRAALSNAISTLIEFNLIDKNSPEIIAMIALFVTINSLFLKSRDFLVNSTIPGVMEEAEHIVFHILEKFEIYFTLELLKKVLEIVYHGLYSVITYYQNGVKLINSGKESYYVIRIQGMALINYFINDY